MSTGIWSAASGAIGQGAALDTAATNIANASTPGFRADHAVFRQTLVGALRGSGNNATSSLRYATVRSSTPDLRNGGLIQTGKPLDVGITDDKGFFVVATPTGERYTRAGSFRLDVNGALRTPDGYAVLGESRQPIQVDPTATDVAIDRDGTVVANGSSVGKLALVTFSNMSGLEKEGYVLLRARPEAGRATPHVGRVEPGALEMSNASAVQEMTSLVNASRQFEMTARIIEAFSVVDRRAATDIMGRR